MEIASNLHEIVTTAPRFSATNGAPPRVGHEPVAPDWPCPARPDAGMVILWRTCVAHLLAREAELNAALAPEERERQARFIAPEDRRRFGLFRGFLRGVLAPMLGVTPAEVRFAAAPGGKPLLDPATHPDAPVFNVSHSGVLLAVAVARAGALGVDVEWPDRRTDIPGVARHSFHPHEFARIAAAEGDEQRRLFFRWWTAKEAVLKASGAGLGGGLAELDFSEWPEGPCAAGRDTDGRDWTVWHYDDGCALSLAASFPLRAISVRSTAEPGAASGALMTRSS